MDFSEDEEDLISRLYNLLGQRYFINELNYYNRRAMPLNLRFQKLMVVFWFLYSWALIAGRIPGRTADEIEKYCSK